MNRKTVLDALRWLLGLGIGAGLFYLAFRGQDWPNLFAQLQHMKFAWVWPAMLVGLASHWLRALRWNLLLVASGHPTTTARAFWAVMAGYLVNNAVPRLGEVSRCSLLLRTDRIPIMTAIGTVLTERLADVLSLGLLVLAVLLPLAPEVQTQVQAMLGAQPRASASAGDSWPGWLWLVLTFCLLLAGLALAWRLRRRLLSAGVAGRLVEALRSMGRAVASIRHVRPRWGFAALSLAIWLAYALFAWLMLQAMPGETAYSFHVALVATAMGGVAMVLPAPGGIGPYHVAVALTFAVFGFDAQDGALAALWLHGPQYVLTCVVGAVGYAVLLLRKRPAAGAP